MILPQNRLLDPPAICTHFRADRVSFRVGVLIWKSKDMHHEPKWHGKRKMPNLQLQWLNSLAPGRPGCHSKTAIFNLVLLIGIFTSSKDNALRWMPRDLTDDKSILVRVMAWCRQATSHLLSQCWPSSMSPYGITRPQWVKDRHKDSSPCNCPQGDMPYYLGSFRPA